MKKLALLLLLVSTTAYAGETCDKRVSSRVGTLTLSSSGFYASCGNCTYIRSECPDDPALNKAVEIQLLGRFPTDLSSKSEEELRPLAAELKDLKAWVGVTVEGNAKQPGVVAEICRAKAYQRYFEGIESHITSRCVALKVEKDAKAILPTLPTPPK